MIWLALLKKYWKPLLAVALFAGWSALMYHKGYSTKSVACELAAQTLEASRLRDVVAQRERSQAKADKTDDKLGKALERPQASPKVREVVDANPSDCSITNPVGDQLREQIAAANKAGAAR